MAKFLVASALSFSLTIAFGFYAGARAGIHIWFLSQAPFRGYIDASYIYKIKQGKSAEVAELMEDDINNELYNFGKYREHMWLGKLFISQTYKEQEKFICEIVKYRTENPHPDPQNFAAIWERAYQIGVSDTPGEIYASQRKKIIEKVLADFAQCH